MAQPQKTLLKQWLEKHDVTQAELAAQVGVTVAFMNNLTNRKHQNIKIDLLRKLADVTRIPMRQLVDDLLLGHSKGAA